MSKDYYIELLDKFYRGSASDKEKGMLKDLIQQKNSKEHFNEYFQQCWHLASNEMSKEVQENMLADIKGKIDSSSEDNIVERKRSFIIFKKILQYAAAACLVLTITLGAYFWGHSQKDLNNGVITMSTKVGQMADFVLSDGTHVYMNSVSKVMYDSSYNKKVRIITLEGEAFFDVAKDKKRPFIVKANGINVQALGTSFNVKAHKDDKTLSVILIKGSVKVNDNKKGEILKPNERLEYNLSSKDFKKTELIPNSEGMLWRGSELALYGESLEEICNDLARTYNCKFIFKSESYKKFTYNGVVKNKSLQNVLDFLCQSASLKYEISSKNTITIY